MPVRAAALRRYCWPLSLRPCCWRRWRQPMSAKVSRVLCCCLPCAAAVLEVGCRYAHLQPPRLGTATRIPRKSCRLPPACSPCTRLPPLPPCSTPRRHHAIPPHPAVPRDCTHDGASGRLAPCLCTLALHLGARHLRRPATHRQNVRGFRLARNLALLCSGGCAAAPAGVAVVRCCWLDACRPDKGAGVQQ